MDNTGKMVKVAYKGFFDDGSVFIDQTEQPIEFPCLDGWMPPKSSSRATNPTVFSAPARTGQTARRASTPFVTAQSTITPRCAGRRNE